MFRLSVAGFIVALLSGCLAHSQRLVEGQPLARSSDALHGVYEFVSEATVLTKPGKASYERMSPDWSGVWHFQNGYYVRVLMKRRRSNFFDRKKLDDIAFESFAGSYEIKGDTISLTQEYAVNPLAVGRSTLMSYRLDGDSLTLIEKLHPYIEDLREGTITTVLHRVK